jgi:hypothetical protein
MDQWAVHIGAMNKLVVGQISLSQANAFWNQTRVGAKQHVTQFQQAMKEVRRTGVDCPSPGKLGQKVPYALRTCVRQVDADLRTLRAARTAIDTWSMHVRDMERLRSGKLSASAATRMWLSMWQRGVHQLQAYREAASAGQRAGGCGTSAAPPARPDGSRGGAPAKPSPSAAMDMEGMH